MDPAAWLGGQVRAVSPEALREGAPIAPAAKPPREEDGQIDPETEAEDQRIDGVDQCCASSSTCQVTSRSAASMSLRVASASPRSRDGVTRSGSPKRTTQRAKGFGIRKPSHERVRHSADAAKDNGTTGAPVRRASLTTPGFTVSAGPRGPSGATMTL